MSKLDKTEVLAAFEAAYEAAHGSKPEVEAKSGWYSVNGGKNVRLADLAAQAEALQSGEQPAETVAEEKPAAAKPAAKKASPAKKAPAASKEVKVACHVVTNVNEQGFTAEELWIKKLAEADHDCRLPRGVV